MHGGGQRSPPRGGVDPGAANQQLLVYSDSGSGDGAARDGVPHMQACMAVEFNLQLVMAAPMTCKKR